MNSLNPTEIIDQTHQIALSYSLHPELSGQGSQLLLELSEAIRIQMTDPAPENHLRFIEVLETFENSFASASLTARNALDEILILLMSHYSLPTGKLDILDTTFSSGDLIAAGYL